MKEFFVNHIDTIFAYIFGAGGLFSAWTQRKKRKTDALMGMQDNYARFVEHSERKFRDFEDEITSLREEIKRVEEHWKRKYDALKRQFENYKKAHP